LDYQENQQMLDYINVYSGKTKIKAINELNTSTVNFMQMFGKDAIVVNPKRSC
jgi:hypothetical protein